MTDITTVALAIDSMTAELSKHKDSSPRKECKYGESCWELEFYHRLDKHGVEKIRQLFCAECSATTTHSWVRCYKEAKRKYVTPRTCRRCKKGYKCKYTDTKSGEICPRTYKEPETCSGCMHGNSCDGCWKCDQCGVRHQESL